MEQKRNTVAKTIDKEEAARRSSAAPAKSIPTERRSLAAVENTEPEKQEPQHTAVALTRPEHDPVREVKAAGLPLAVQQVNIPREQSSFATQALQEDNEKEIAAASEPASSNKNKLRGLFRKVARTFGKTADRDGEGKREVLINAFQVAVD